MNVQALERLLGRAPRLLFVAYTYPPANLPGSTRTSNIARQLARLGWAVTVLTVDESQWSARYRDSSVGPAHVRRITARVKWPVLAVPQVDPPAGVPVVLGRAMRKAARLMQVDPEIGWNAAAEAATSAMEEGDVDVVLVSAPPFSTAELAARLARRLRCPYVVDYRDLWTLNPTASRRAPRRLVRAERELTARAAAAITIGPIAARALAEEFGLYGKVHVVPNGYDAELLGAVTPARFDGFSIVYAGTFYFQRRIDPLFRALALIHRQNRMTGNWRFHYYGSDSAHVLAAADALGLPRERVVDHGVVLRADALAATAGADLVTVITSSSDEPTTGERGIVTGKIFEAIGLRRQMLVIGPVDSDVQAVVDTSGLGCVIPPRETETIASHIVHRAGGGEVAAKDPEEFAWHRLGPRLSDVLAGVAAGGHH